MARVPEGRKQDITNIGEALMSLEFREIPRRVHAFLERVGIEVKAGQTISSVLARELKGAMGYRVPEGQRLVVNITIRARLEDAEA